jgi:hypothetical protein
MKKIIRFLFKLVIGLIIFILIVLLVYQFIPSPAKTVRQFFTYLMEENYPRAYQLIDGEYKKSRGSLDKFTSDYRDAVRSGTRTKMITIQAVKNGNDKNERIVDVVVRILYQGGLVDTNGSYLLEKLPNKGWKIIKNVSSERKK